MIGEHRRLGQLALRPYGMYGTLLVRIRADQSLSDAKLSSARLHGASAQTSKEVNP